MVPSFVPLMAQSSVVPTRTPPLTSRAAAGKARPTPTFPYASIRMPLDDAEYCPITNAPVSMARLLNRIVASPAWVSGLEPPAPRLGVSEIAPPASEYTVRPVLPCPAL